MARAHQHVLRVVVAASVLAACSGGSDDAADDSDTPTTTETTEEAAPPSGEGVPDPAGRIAFGRIMAGHEDTDQLTALYAINPDGTDLVQLTDGNSSFPAWSPDGTRIAFTQMQPDGSTHIATIAADGSDIRLLTSGHGIYGAASWSPDGTWLAYEYSPQLPHEPGFHTVLYRMDADGSNQAMLGDPQAFDSEPKVSPDGRSVLFQRYLDATAPLLVRDIETGDERTLLAAGGQNPSWSPDGESIVTQTDPATETEIWGPIVSLAVDGDEADAVELYPGGGESGGFKPVYSPDGRRIAFGCGSGAGGPAYDEAICVMNDDGSEVDVLVNSPDQWDNEVAWGVAAS